MSTAARSERNKVLDYAKHMESKRRVLTVRIYSGEMKRLRAHQADRQRREGRPISLNECLWRLIMGAFSRRVTVTNGHDHAAREEPHVLTLRLDEQAFAALRARQASLAERGERHISLNESLRSLIWELDGK